LRAPAAPRCVPKARLLPHFRPLRLAASGFSGCEARPEPRKTRRLNPIAQSGIIRPWELALPASHSGSTPRRAKKRFPISQRQPVRGWSDAWVGPTPPSPPKPLADPSPGKPNGGIREDARISHGMSEIVIRATGWPEPVRDGGDGVRGRGLPSGWPSPLRARRIPCHKSFFNTIR